MDCGLEVFKAEFARVGSPLLPSEVTEVYAVVEVWSAQALATAVKETECGKTAGGVHNLFNIFNSEGNAPVDFLTWEQGAESWAMRFLDPDYKHGVYMPRAMSIEQQIATYQGGPDCWDTHGASCANGETWAPCTAGSIELSIQQFCARVSTYMGVPQEVPWVPVAGGAGCTPTPGGASPVVYRLPQDAGHFGISQQCANSLVDNRFENRSGSRVSTIVIHVQEGTTPGSLDWWCSQGIQASSTVMIQHDGSVLQIVPEQHGPWTNGDTCNPTSAGLAMINQCGNNPNCCSLTIETEGYYNQAHQAPQIEAIAWQCKQWMSRYGLTCANILAHRDINRCSRPNCCGSTIFNAAMSALGCPQRW